MLSTNLRGTLTTQGGREVVATGLERIAELVKTRPEYKLQSLMHIINTDTLVQSHKELAGNKAVGVDKVGKEAYEENLATNLESLIARMKKWSYRPQPSKRVYIPKEVIKKGQLEYQPMRTR